MKKNSLSLLGCILGLMVVVSSAESAPKRASKKAAATKPTPAPAIVLPTLGANPTPVPPTVISESLQPWWLIAGLDLGLSTYSPFNPVTQGSRSGLAIGGRVLVSYYFRELVNEGGLGWQYISSSGQNPQGTTDSVRTKVPYIDLSSRYRFNRRWQLGPELEYWLATDNGLNHDVTTTDSNHGIFLGLECVYEWNKSRKTRAGGRWLTAMNVDGRTVNHFQIFYEVAFDVFRKHDEEVAQKTYEGVTDYDLRRSQEMNPREALPIGTPEPQVTDQSGNTFESSPVTIGTPVPPGAEAPARLVHQEEQGQAYTLILYGVESDLPFGTNDANLPKANSDRVKAIGKFLAKNSKLWKSMIVAGHTDERGSKPKNQSLSLARAELVRSLLIQGGVEASRMKAKGFGELQPISNRHDEEGLKKNRRVELRLRGVTDLKIIKKALEQ